MTFVPAENAHAVVKCWMKCKLFNFNEAAKIVLVNKKKVVEGEGFKALDYKREVTHTQVFFSIKDIKKVIIKLISSSENLMRNFSDMIGTTHSVLISESQSGFTLHISLTHSLRLVHLKHSNLIKSFHFKQWEFLLATRCFFSEIKNNSLAAAVSFSSV